MNLPKLYSPPTLKILKPFCCNQPAKLVLTSECPGVLKTRSALPEAMLGNVLKGNPFKSLDYQGLFELFELFVVLFRDLGPFIGVV